VPTPGARPSFAENGGILGHVPFGIGIWEILILLLVILLVFGPRRLPEMGRSLGRGMREFKESISGKDHEELAELPPPGEQERIGSTRERNTVR
jgi:sec-independent protein translocase protein TatA